MCGPQVRFCERCGGATPRAYSTQQPMPRTRRGCGTPTTPLLPLCVPTRRGGLIGPEISFFSSTCFFEPVPGRKSTIRAWKSRGRVIFWCSSGPAVLPGEDQMGNIDSTCSHAESVTSHQENHL